MRRYMNIVWPKNTSRVQDLRLRLKIDFTCGPGKVRAPVVLIDRILLVHIDLKELIVNTALVVLVPNPCLSLAFCKNGGVLTC